MFCLFYFTEISKPHAITSTWHSLFILLFIYIVTGKYCSVCSSFLIFLKFANVYNSCNSKCNRFFNWIPQVWIYVHFTKKKIWIYIHLILKVEYISQIRKIIIVKTIKNNLCNAYGQPRNLIASVKITWTK